MKITMKKIINIAKIVIPLLGVIYVVYMSIITYGG